MKHFLAAFVFVAALALALPAQAQHAEWLWWGTSQTTAVPVSAANPLPINLVAGGLPQPIINGDCLLGSAGNTAIWGSCAGGAAVASVANSDGTLTISPTTGSVVASLALGHANTWTGQQTFVAPILGTPVSGNLSGTTGYLASALAGTTLASGVTASSLTSLGTIATGVWQGTKIGLAYGGLNLDLTATGGTSQVVKQTSSGGAITVARLACGDLSDSGSGCSGSAGSGSGVGVQGGQSPSTTNMGDTGTSGSHVALTAAKYLYATTGSYTAARYKNLPDSATQGVGDVEILDVVGTLTSTNTLNICPAGTDTINGVNGCLPGIGTAYASLRLHNDGAGAWTTAGGATTPAFTASAHNFVTGISGGGVWSQAQPAFTDISAGAITAAQMLALPSADLYVGNGSNVPAAVAMSGDATMANTGAITIANLAVTNAKIANTTIDLTAKVTGTLPYGNGGTGATALTNHGAVVAGASALSTVAPGTNGNVLTSNGTDWTSAAAAGGSGGGTFNYSDNGVTLTAGTYFTPIGGGGIPQTTEANVDVKAPSALTVNNLQVGISADPGSGQTLAVTLRKNAADTTLTCTITGTGGGTAVACQDLTHSIAVAQNDTIDWKIITTGTYVATPTVTITANSGTTNNGVTGSGTTGSITKFTGSASVGNATAADLPATTLATGTSVSLTAPRQYYVCTGTCTVTPPVPAAGYEFCVMNDDNVATVITLAALGSSARYEATARTSYGTAGTGTFVSGGAAKDQVCIVGRDSTHYLTTSSVGTWTAN